MRSPTKSSDKIEITERCLSESTGHEAYAWAWLMTHES